MSNYLITGFHGKPHVTAENDRGIYASIFGKGRFVLPVGEEFRAEVIGDNKIRIYDGKLVDNGAVAGIPVGEYVDIIVPTVGQGKQCLGYIIFEYIKDSSTLIETGDLASIWSEDFDTFLPEYFPKPYQEDLLSGTATRDQMLLHAVVVDAREGDIKIYTEPRFEVWSRTDEKFQADINDLYEKYAIVGKAAETCGKDIASLSADITNLYNTAESIDADINNLETKHNNQILSCQQRLQVLENAEAPVVGVINISDDFIVGTVQPTNLEYNALVYRYGFSISGTLYIEGNLHDVFEEFGMLAFDINSNYSIMGETHCNFYCENSTGEVIIPNMHAAIQQAKMVLVPFGDIDNSDLTLRISFSYICKM